MNMNTNLLDIQPEELKFIYELKKQSSCSVRLINNSHKHVAFKVKTTVPKKYCVRPNVGVIMPKSTCDFTVIMQAQGPAPPDLVCKDKFLVQSTIVSGSTTNEDITRDMFVKGGDKYVEERKLRVSLLTPPHSPVLSPMNGKSKQEPAYEASVLKDQVLGRVEIAAPQEKIAKDEISSKITSGLELNPMNVVESSTKSAEFVPVMDAKLGPASDAGSIPIKNAELLSAKDAGYTPVRSAEVLPTKDAGSVPINNAESSPTKDAKFKQAKDEGVSLTNNAELSSTRDAKCKQAKDEGISLTNNEELSSRDAKFNPTKDEGFALTENAELTPVKDVKLTSTQDAQLRSVKEADMVLVNDVEELELVKNIEDLKSKLIELESKLSEAEATISKLTEENRLSNQDSQLLRKELEWRKKRGARKVKEGFPLLFVCMVALVCIMLGYRLHPGI